MAVRGMALTPTLAIAPSAPQWLPGMGLAGEGLKDALRNAEGMPEMARRASEAGLRVLAGTDAGMGPHGMIGYEVELMVEGGMPRAKALGAASWAARKYLGWPVIEEGALAVYETDPREDPEALRLPLLLMLDGKIVSPA